jgi:hypothetical protein
MRAHAIWLGVAHRLLTIDGAPFGVDVPAGERPLADWRAAHQHYFEAEGARVGIPFGDDAELEYEQFRLLGVFQRAG